MAKSKSKTKSNANAGKPLRLQDQLREVRIAKGREELRAKRFENDKEAGRLVAVDPFATGLTSACVRFRSRVMSAASDVTAWVPQDSGKAKAAMEAAIRCQLANLVKVLRGDRA